MGAEWRDGSDHVGQPNVNQIAITETAAVMTHGHKRAAAAARHKRVELLRDMLIHQPWWAHTPAEVKKWAFMRVELGADSHDVQEAVATHVRDGAPWEWVLAHWSSQ